jgi:hypothetical protein
MQIESHAANGKNVSDEPVDRKACGSPDSQFAALLGEFDGDRLRRLIDGTRCNSGR